MRKLESLSFRFDGEKIWILDQTLLPQELQWLDVTAPANMIAAIQKLQVRGAPLIGVAASVCLARQVEMGLPEKEFRKTAELLREARPTAVNLMVAIDRLLKAIEKKFVVRDIIETAERIYFEDVELCEKIARQGESLIAEGDGILTHCNTGGLATAGVGTAIGIIRKAHSNGKKIHVYVDETRPLLQGGRLTAWEMKELNIPYTLICDNMAAIMMREGHVQKVIVGCDRIALNGDFANKVGTYGLAILARHHKIPFYVAGPYTTIDPNCQTGTDIPIEERKGEEVRGAQGAFGESLWAPTDSPVRNPAFDVTPFDLVSGWILDKQILYPEDIKNGGLFACMPL